MEPSGTAEAASFAWVTALYPSNTTKYRSYWAQCGYVLSRVKGSTKAVRYRWAEINGSSNGHHAKRDAENAPAEGSKHKYRCELDQATGTWYYYEDEATTPWHQFQDDGWKSPQTASYAQWQGEIHNLEDDMPGTSDHPCQFTGCQFKKVGAGYTGDAITKADVKSDDPNRWGSEWVGASAFNIWDKHPLP